MKRFALIIKGRLAVKAPDIIARNYNDAKEICLLLGYKCELAELIN